VSVRTRVACNEMKRFVVGFLCLAFGTLMVTRSKVPRRQEMTESHCVEITALRKCLDTVAHIEDAVRKMLENL